MGLLVCKAHLWRHHAALAHLLIVLGWQSVIRVSLVNFVRQLGYLPPPVLVLADTFVVGTQ